MLGDYLDAKQAPAYAVSVILGLKWVSQYIWNKGESTQALASRVAANTAATTANAAQLVNFKNILDRANEELSKKMSALNEHLLKIDIMQAEIKTELRLSRGYRRDDSDSGAA